MKLIVNRKLLGYNEANEVIVQFNNVKMQQPIIHIEETEINFLSNKTWIPGKTTWMPIEAIFTTENIEDIKRLKESKYLVSPFHWAAKEGSLGEIWYFEGITFSSLTYNFMNNEVKAIIEYTSGRLTPAPQIIP